MRHLSYYLHNKLITTYDYNFCTLKCCFFSACLVIFFNINLHLLTLTLDNINIDIGEN